MPDELKPVLERQMEVYAGFLEHTDHHVGRVIDAIEDLGVLDDTIIYYIIGREVFQPMWHRRFRGDSGDPEELEAGRLRRDGDELHVEDRLIGRLHTEAVAELPCAALRGPRRLHEHPERQRGAGVEPQQDGVTLEEGPPRPAHPQEREHRSCPLEGEADATDVPGRRSTIRAEHLDPRRRSERGDREPRISRQRGRRGELGEMRVHRVGRSGHAWAGRSRSTPRDPT